VRETLERVLADLGRRLAELRRERGWTQAKAADAAGMPEKDYQAIENGRQPITIRTAVTLAQLFDTTVQSLFAAPASREPRRPGRPARDDRVSARKIPAAEKPPKKEGTRTRRS
jgi:transcriptional regulator with XRE-family HTH domain